MSTRRGGPVHKNKFAWKPKAGVKINETEVGGRFRPLSEITGVCPRCREQIDWKRRYGKYKTLTEPTKCQKCTKRNVRQAYHKLCSGCAKEQRVCAKCCCRVDQIVGRDISEVEAEQKTLDEAIKNARERDRRSLIRAMNKENNPKKSDTTPILNDDKVGDIFPGKSLEDYAKSGGRSEGIVSSIIHNHDDGDEDSDSENVHDDDGNDDDDDDDDESDDKEDGEENGEQSHSQQ